MGACGSKKSTESKEGKTAKERREAWKRIRQEIPLEKTEEAKQRRIELFQKFDVNNTGRLSYAEVYDGCCRELKMEEFTTHLPEITRRAFNKAKDLGTKVKGSGSEDFVEFLEFRLMLCYLYNNFELTVMFDEIDKSGNMLIDEKEFKNAVPKLKEWGVDIVDPEAMFKELDKNGSGSVAFDEFAAWASGQKLELSGDPDGS